MRWISELQQPFFNANQTSKVINDENTLYHTPFSIALKSMIMSTNAQNMCQIICRNVQTSKWHTNFKNISSRFTAIYSELSKLIGMPFFYKLHNILIYYDILN